MITDCPIYWFWSWAINGNQITEVPISNQYLWYVIANYMVYIESYWVSCKTQLGVLRVHPWALEATNYLLANAKCTLSWSSNIKYLNIAWNNLDTALSLHMFEKHWNNNAYSSDHWKVTQNKFMVMNARIMVS